MIDIIIVVILLSIVVSAISYIVKEKKRGVRCIGCPEAGTCAKRICNCCSGEK